MSGKSAEAKDTFVYVVQNEHDNSIKIGRSNDPAKRLRDLQTGSVDRLALKFRLPVDKKIAPRVERKARDIGERDFRRKRVDEWLCDTNPVEGETWARLAQDMVLRRNAAAIIRHRVMVALANPSDEDLD